MIGRQFILLAVLIFGIQANENVLTKDIDGHLVKCEKVGYQAHPTDTHKYILCENIQSGTNKGLHLNVFSCPPGLVWNQEKALCDYENKQADGISKIIDGHVVKCNKEGYQAHPTDSHKYITCEHVNKGLNRGWFIRVMDCAPGTVFEQKTVTCVVESNQADGISKTIDGHLVKCNKEGYQAHPTDSHKYITCEHVTKGLNRGWFIRVMDCVPGTVFDQKTVTCAVEGNQADGNSKSIDGHLLKCYKEGYLAHPTDSHKYISCEYVTKRANKGWFIRVMNCAPGTVFDQKTATCVLESNQDDGISKIIDGHVIKCNKEGYQAHPTNSHKYITCEHVTKGVNQGWLIRVMDCAPGTIFEQKTVTCVLESNQADGITKTIDGHVVTCNKEGYKAHPTDSHKYITCEHVTKGANQGWFIRVMDCAPGTHFDQTTKTCVQYV